MHSKADMQKVILAILLSSFCMSFEKQCLALRGFHIGFQGTGGYFGGQTLVGCVTVAPRTEIVESSSGPFWPFVCWKVFVWLLQWPQMYLPDSCGSLDQWLEAAASASCHVNLFLPNRISSAPNDVAIIFMLSVTILGRTFSAGCFSGIARTI